MAAVVRYVDASLTTGSNNGTSWENAYQGASGLNTALNAVSANYTQVYVKPGVYSPIVVARNYNPVTIESTDGAETTIVDGGTVWAGGVVNGSPEVQGKRCLTITNGTNWTFKGFTFRNGFTKSGDGQTTAGSCGGIECNGAGRCILRNCIVHSCYAGTSKNAMRLTNTYFTEVYNCRGGYQNIDSGTHYDLKVHDCSTSSHSAGIYGGTTYRMEMWNCSPHSGNSYGAVVNTGTHYYAHVHDCIAYGDTAETSFTQLISQATMVNCHVHDCKGLELSRYGTLLYSRIHDCIGTAANGCMTYQTVMVHSSLYDNSFPSANYNGAVYQPKSVVGCTIVGNVLGGSDNPTVIAINPSSWTTVTEFFRNNIVVGNVNTGGTPICDVGVYSTGYGTSNFTMDNCWIGITSTRTAAISSIMAGIASRSTNHHVGESPKFLDPANGLYCLAPDSPCIGAAPYERQHPLDCRYMLKGPDSPVCAGAYEFGSTIYCDPSDRQGMASRGNNLGYSWANAFYGPGCLDKALGVALPYDTIVLAKGEYTISGDEIPCVVKGIDGNPRSVVIHCASDLSASWSDSSYRPGFESATVDGSVSATGLSFRRCVVSMGDASGCHMESSLVSLGSPFSGDASSCTFRVPAAFSGQSILGPSGSIANCLFLPGEGYALTGVVIDPSGASSSLSLTGCLRHSSFGVSDASVGTTADTLAGFSDPNLTRLSLLEKTSGDSSAAPGKDLFNRDMSGTEVGCCSFMQSEATSWYCDANLATGRNDGSSWENALQGAGSMQAAVSAAASGDTVFLEDGTYDTSSGGSGITVKSRNGHGECVVAGAQGGSQQSGAIAFEGVTFMSTSSASVSFDESPKTFVGCVFDGCVGSGQLLKDAAVEDCLFLGCSVPSASPLFRGTTLDGCTISGCVWDASLGIINRGTGGSPHMFDCVVDSVPSGSVLCTGMTATSSSFGGNVINGIDSPNGLNADPLLDSSHKPTSSSPVIGYGSPSRMAATDLDGVQRKPAPAAGCFELDDTVYVDVDAIGKGTGKNWDDAFTTIQAGVDAAKDGGKVLVADGTYYECVEVPTKRVDISSANGNANCVVDASKTCNTDAIAQLYDDSNYKKYNRIDGYRNGRCFSSKAIQGSKHYSVTGLTLTGGHTRALNRTLHEGRQAAYGICSGAAAWGYFFLRDCIIEGHVSQHAILCGTGTGKAAIDRCIIRNCLSQNTYEGTNTMGGDGNVQAACYVTGITNSLIYGIRSYGSFNGSSCVLVGRSYHISNCTVVPSLGTLHRATNTSARRIALYLRGGGSAAFGPAAGKPMGVFNCVVVRDEPIQYGTETTARTIANSVVSTTGNIEANTTKTNIVYQDDVLDANFRPRRNSPAIGLSNKTYVYGDTDLAGNPRKENPAAGCYEAPDVFDPDDTGSGGLYVSSDLQTGLGTGTSWANAARGPESLSIASDLSEADGNVINVDDGTYLPVYRFDNRPITFVSRNGPDNCVIDAGNEIVSVDVSVRATTSVWYPDNFWPSNNFLCACMRTGFSTASQVKVCGITLRNGVSVGYPSGWNAINHAAYNNGGGSVFGIFEDCVFDGCVSVRRATDASGGGAAYATVRRCRFNHCVADNYGGGIYNCNADSCVFDRCLCVGNDGGAAYLTEASRKVTGCTFMNCMAMRYGIVRSTTSTTEQFVDCLFVGNRSGINSMRMGSAAETCGYGGIYRNCRFIRNTNGTTSETGSSIVGHAALVADCLFEYNSCAYGCAAFGTVTGSVFRYNNTSRSVLYGGVTSTGSTTHFSNCLVYDNNCGSVVERHRAFNCTFYRNRCTSNVATNNGASGNDVCNCLIVDNMPANNTSASTGVQTSTGGFVCNNVMRGSTHGSTGTVSGNVIVSISGSVGFVDQSSPDLHLAFGSPAIGAGSASYLQMTTDLDGNPWASTPSAGCYEYRPYSPSGLPASIAPFGSLARILKVGARRYATVGLTQMWDGIENAGYGVHDSSATKWKALVGGSSWDATLSAVGSFDSNSLVCAGGERSDGKSIAAAFTSGTGNFTTSNLRTIEVCYRLDSKWGRNGTSGTQGPQFVLTTRLGSATASGRRSIAYTVGSTTTNHQKVTVDITSNAANSAIDMSEKFQKAVTLSAVYTGNNVTRIYLNGVEVVSKMVCPSGRDGDASYVSFGGRKDLYGMSGHIYSVRLYNTVLADAQLAENAMIDRQRFGFEL